MIGEPRTEVQRSLRVAMTKIIDGRTMAFQQMAANCVPMNTEMGHKENCGLLLVRELC